MKNNGKRTFKVFSTFTGIGGFEVGIENATLDPVEIIGYSEIDKYAVQVYEHHFKGVKNYGDITKIKAEKLPDFDCLVGGFPCQAFSIAGRRAGFADTRGTLFFDLARILRAKQPRLFVFENVKGLISHDGGSTFRTIVTAINELGYDCQWQVLNSKDFGVPQNRERIIIVGHLRGTARPQVFPIRQNDKENTGGNQKRRADIFPTIRATHYKSGDNQPLILQRARGNNKGGPKAIAPTISARSYEHNNHVVQLTEARTEEAKRIRRETTRAGREYAPRRGKVLVPRKDNMANTVTASQSKEGLVMISKTVRAGGRGSPHGAKQNWDSYEIDGKIRRLTPIECERLQAFPDNWTRLDGVSDSQRYKMCGNAVTTTVIQAVFERIFDKPYTVL